MKKIISLMLVLMMAMLHLGSGFTSYAAESLGDEEYAEGVMILTDTELVNMSTNLEQEEFMKNGGIVVVYHENGDNKQAGNSLGMTLLVESSKESENNENSDKVSLFYMYGNNLQGTYIITGSQDEEQGLDELVEEAIVKIRERQSEYGVATISEKTGATSLGMVDITGVLGSKGKVAASYEIYTIQDYHERDFYIVKSCIDGIPQAAMNGQDMDMMKYQLEDMHAVIETDTSSVTVDAYGPHPTVDSKTYSVDLSGSWSLGTDFSISGGNGFSYSGECKNANIGAADTGKKAYWDVTLKNDAQKTSFTFEPGVTFVCPYNKSAVTINVFASCLFDSWYDFEESIEIDRTIICTPDSLEDY